MVIDTSSGGFSAAAVLVGLIVSPVGVGGATVVSSAALLSEVEVGTLADAVEVMGEAVAVICCSEVSGREVGGEEAGRRHEAVNPAKRISNNQP